MVENLMCSHKYMMSSNTAIKSLLRTQSRVTTLVCVDYTGLVAVVMVETVLQGGTVQLSELLLVTETVAAVGGQVDSGGVDLPAALQGAVDQVTETVAAAVGGQVDSGGSDLKVALQGAVDLHAQTN